MKIRAEETALLVVVALISVVVGTRSLEDPDFGWHLAGGLWMLDNLRVPATDPFGAQGNFWLCYSWLAEVLFGLVFKYGGFRGLQVFQTLLVTAGAVSLCFFCRALCVEHEEQQSREHLYPVLAGVFTIILFSAPIWYLRPQLFSLIFTAAVLWLCEKRRGNIRALLCLAVIWANIHVYWVFVPVVAFLYGVAKQDGCRAALIRSLVLFAAGFATPYGWRTYSALGEFLFSHREVYRQIIECQKLSPGAGYLFWLFAAVVLVCVCCAQTLWRKSPGLVLVSCLFAAASVIGLRLIPFFGVAGGMLLSLGVKEMLKHKKCAAVRRAFINEACTPAVRVSTGKLTAAAVGAVLLGGVLAMLFELPQPITQRNTELFYAVRRMGNIGRDFGQKPVNLLNHFNDGGWLILALYLERDAGHAASRFKAGIDGRTAMTGAQRFMEFDVLERLSPNWCHILEEWDVGAAVLPCSMRLARVLSGKEHAEGSCRQTWRELFAEGRFCVLKKE